MPPVDPRSRRSLLKSLRQHQRRKTRSTKALKRLIPAVARARKAIRVANVTIPKRKAQLRALPADIGLAALSYARKELVVRESGGNNAGTPYTRYQQTNGASAPEPWCGDFMAYIFRKAGSKIVDRRWAAVVLVALVDGIRKHQHPKPGYMVRFDWPGGQRGDHIGIVEVVHPDGSIGTIEGNTRPGTAASDSGGGEGVYRRNRKRSECLDFLEVTR